MNGYEDNAPSATGGRPVWPFAWGLSFALASALLCWAGLIAMVRALT